VASDVAAEVVEGTQERATLPRTGAGVHRSARGRTVPRTGLGMGEAKTPVAPSSLLVAAVAETTAAAVEHKAAEERIPGGLDRKSAVPVAGLKPVRMLRLELEMQPAGKQVAPDTARLQRLESERRREPGCTNRL